MDIWGTSLSSAGSGNNSSGLTHQMQQIKLPRSTLKTDLSSFQLVEQISLSNSTWYEYSRSWVFGDMVYILRNSSIIHCYNKATKTEESSINVTGFSNAAQGPVQIIIGSKVYLLHSYNVKFCVFDLISRTWSSLTSPIIPTNYSSSSAFGIASMRYDSVYNKIYAFIPIRYFPSSTYYYTELLEVYDIASNTWTLLIAAPNGNAVSDNSYRIGRTCLIDFSESTVKFVSNAGRTGGNPWSFSTNRSANPTGGVFTSNETVYTSLQGIASPSYNEEGTIVQTDDEVFGLIGSKLFKFNLFTGENTEENLLGAVPLAAIGSPAGYTAARSFGVTFNGGKLWYCDGLNLYAMDYNQSIDPNGALAWKIFAGQKYSAIDPLTIHKADGSIINITTEQQLAEEDIEIRIGEYNNYDSEKYILIES